MSQARRYYLESYANKEGADSTLTIKFSGFGWRVAGRVFICILFGGELTLDGVKLTAKIKSN